jgi:hypothetical protein
VPVTVMTEVLKHALVKMPTPLEEKPVDVTSRPAENKQKDMIHH